jgi:hypothetical protein
LSRSPSSAYRSENDELRREAGWIRRQSLRVLVDMSPGINLFPDLRLVDNIKEEYEASLAAIDHVLAKMAILGARDLIVSLHRQPENNYTGAQTQTDFDKTMRQICKDAEARRITVHLRMSPGKPPWGLQAAVDFLERVAADNLRLAPSVAMLLADQTDPTKAADIVRNKVDLWLVAASEHDVAGRLWNTHAGITKFGRKNNMAAILGIVADKPTILDAVYPDKDAEYLDARALSRLVTEGTTSKPQDMSTDRASTEHGAAN